MTSNKMFNLYSFYIQIIYLINKYIFNNVNFTCEFGNHFTISKILTCNHFHGYSNHIHGYGNDLYGVSNHFSIFEILTCNILSTMVTTFMAPVTILRL